MSRGLPLEAFVNDDQVPQVLVQAQAAEVHRKARDDGCDTNLVAKLGIVVPDDTFLEVIGGARVVGDHVVNLLQVAHLGAVFVVAGGDVHQHVLGGLEVEIVQEGTLEGTLYGLVQAVGTGAFAAAHEGHAGVAHHLAHILEVHVDVTGAADDLDDAADGGGQHFIGLGEGLLDEGVAKELVQFLVVDNQEGVHVLFQLVDAVHSLGLALVTLVLEGNGDNGHGEDAAFLGHLGDDRGGTRTGTAAHAGRDEEHLRAAVQHLPGNLVLGFQGGVAAGGRVCSGTQAVLAQLDFHRHLAGLQGLRIGIAHNKTAPLDVLAVHVVHGVTAASAHAYHLDDGVLAGPVVGDNVGI